MFRQAHRNSFCDARWSLRKGPLDFHICFYRSSPLSRAKKTTKAATLSWWIHDISIESTDSGGNKQYRLAGPPHLPSAEATKGRWNGGKSNEELVQTLGPWDPGPLGKCQKKVQQFPAWPRIHQLFLGWYLLCKSIDSILPWFCGWNRKIEPKMLANLNLNHHYICVRLCVYI